MNWSVIVEYEDGTFSVDDIVCRGGKHPGSSHGAYHVYLGPHRIGLVQGDTGYDGWWATPASRQYDMNGVIHGPLSVKGFKSRRHAITYLLEAERFYVHDSEERPKRKGTGRYLEGRDAEGLLIPNPNYKG